MPQIPFEQALQLVLQQVNPAPAVEEADLLLAVGRVLAAPVIADRDQPAFPRSTRDGYAVRLGDSTRKIVGQLRAGEAWPRALAPGEALQIMTGAPVPAGAEAVLMVEHALVEGERLTLDRTLAPGENIVAQGAEAHAGQAVLAAGVRIGPAEIAVAATCGRTRLPVFARPAVAVIATGDELVEVAETPAAHQIRNSNSYAIAALATASGGVARRLPIAADTRKALRDSIASARESDVLVFSGGVSMGEYDLVEAVLAEFGAKFHFTGVQMQPGKPVVFGTLPARDGLVARPFFGLPGNPVSTEVTFQCFVSPFLRALGGETEAAPRWAQGTVTEAIAAKNGLTRLLPARLSGTSVSLVPWQGSGDLAANARANCYAELLPGMGYEAGSVIRILLRW